MNNPTTKMRLLNSFDQKYGEKHSYVHYVISWQQIDDDGNVIKEWESLNDAAKYFNITRQHLWNAYKGNYKS